MSLMNSYSNLNSINQDSPPKPIQFIKLSEGKFSLTSEAESFLLELDNKLNQLNGKHSLYINPIWYEIF